ncbi:hypothetical protein [Burkholderia plantarii]|uniref:hypothetical protein n=1 Tax=Burkholderia plantarii TaxID=41899 RepID=UPI000F4DA531|nr:hypothetical protein [Burkholderia plantarii]
MVTNETLFDAARPSIVRSPPARMFVFREYGVRFRWIARRGAERQNSTDAASRGATEKDIAMPRVAVPDRDDVPDASKALLDAVRRRPGFVPASSLACSG